jgi:sugar O-acyltransferase (sialic acid O-acetyltransferase NeuD family)
VSKLIVNKGLTVLGSGGHAKVLIESAIFCGYEIDYLLDDDVNKHNSIIGGYRITGPIIESFNGYSIIAIGDNLIRKKICLRLTILNWTTIIHPSSIISKDVFIGEGSVIMAGAIIQPGTKIGKHCIINTGACVDHDCVIGDFVHIAPNSTLAGGVTIGEGTLIGIGSSIIPNITVGSWTNVGAGSVIITDQPDNCTIVGVPAKPIKFNNEQN